ncbi:MAG: F0F1 ATP synthase subunit gamma [Bacteroidaceae bacterium]|nr:F0F1 ATP synthase subunit gamma [Bacteroidaceae bacterium]
MASLKEVKGRIATVNNTRKITSAMKMVASAKLHKAQAAITRMLPYEQRISRLLANFLSGSEQIVSPFTVQRKVKRMALIVFSSNSSLCGGFNANVIKHTQQWLEKHAHLPQEDILLYPVGRKVWEALTKQGYQVQGDFQHMADKPTFAEAAALAQSLMEMYQKGEVDRVELLYNHFKSTSKQVLTNEVYLPIPLPDQEETSGETDYILEPSRAELLAMLLPKVLRLKLYTVLLDSNASEHAARTLAMQIATDNADDLLQELTLMYNKTRQQAITNELLDIVGGSMA